MKIYSGVDLKKKKKKNGTKKINRHPGVGNQNLSVDKSITDNLLILIDRLIEIKLKLTNDSGMISLLC